MRVVRAMLRRPAAGCARAELEMALGWSPDTLLAALAELSEEGFERVLVSGPDAGWVSLTEWAAVQVGWQLSQDGGRWVKVRPGRVHAPLPRQLAPEDGRRRDVEVPAYSAEDRLPRPTVILMGCDWVWVERPHTPENPCPACLGKRLPPTHYCLRCDRWGLGHRLRLRRRERAREADGLKGGVD